AGMNPVHLRGRGKTMDQNNRLASTFVKEGNLHSVVAKTACAAAFSGHWCSAGTIPTRRMPSGRTLRRPARRPRASMPGPCRWHPCGRHLYPIGDATGRAMGAVLWADGRSHQALEPAPVRWDKSSAVLGAGAI